jgi:hypothetical protein
LHPYFKGYHELNYKEELAGLWGDFTLTASFDFDTTGTIKNIRFNDKKAPAPLREYINKLWQPAIQHCQKVTTLQYSCQFFFYDKRISKEKRDNMVEDELKQDFNKRDVSIVRETIPLQQKGIPSTYLSY